MIASEYKVHKWKKIGDYSLFDTLKYWGGFELEYANVHQRYVKYDIFYTDDNISIDKFFYCDLELESIGEDPFAEFNLLIRYEKRLELYVRKQDKFGNLYNSIYFEEEK